VDFSPVKGTGNNCSGTVTPWNSLVSCEEAISSVDLTPEGRKVKGWCVEIDPVSKQVKDKLWALGNFKHENIVVHKNQRTVYQGADSNPGYLYKFVADKEKDLSSGDLFVFKGAKNGAGIWLKINNLTPEEQNTTLEQSGVVEATVFNGIEDVEIGPDGLIYFAVKGEGQVYRFKDSDPVAGLTVPSMETFVGNATYTIEGNTGTANANWGLGNDNLAFDKDGNLWVLQDGGLNYIWVVQKGHTQINPKVKIFGRTPSGSEPTGITFSPDFRFLFMSIQHPSGSNNSSMQEDAAGTILSFDKDVTLVIARSEHLGSSPMSLTQENESEMLGFPNPVSNHFTMLLKEPISDVKVVVLQADGKMIRTDLMENGRQFTVDLSKEAAGMYFIELWSNKTKVKVAKALKL
ncbi:MAG: secreted PhoX family phosphatase, partial [Sphingobacteriales bacterium]